VTETAVAAPPLLRRQTPARALALEPDVQVLWLRALITGGLIGALALLVLFLPIAWPEWAGGEFEPTLLVLKWVLCSAVGIVLAVWLWLVQDTRKHLWTVEETMQHDLDGDGIVGPPSSRPEPLASFEVHLRGPHPHQHKVVWLDVPIALPLFNTFVTAALNGGALTESDWCGGGNPFNLSQFKRTRSWMLEHGFGRWRNNQAPARGWELTPAGQDMLGHFQRWYEAHREELEYTRTHTHTNRVLDFVPAAREE
jgi:hypothetical protein